MSDALQRLRDGNLRFVEGRSEVDTASLAEARSRTADGQSPFAVVLTCADSRVPPEMIFDQGIGDLFVIRVAGNVVTPEVIGSVEFAVTALGSGLVVSMGHARCGAVGAAVDQRLASATDLSEALQAIVDGITPAVDVVLGGQAGEGNAGESESGESDAGESDAGESDAGAATRDADVESVDRDEIVAAAVRENARASARALLKRSPVLAEHADQHALTIVSAEYDLTTGLVTFL